MSRQIVNPAGEVLAVIDDDISSLIQWLLDDECMYGNCYMIIGEHHDGRIIVDSILNAVGNIKF